MRIGLLVSGDTVVRAAHSLTAHPDVAELVVIGPAKSKNFQVVATAEGCDLLLGAGPEAPKTAVRHGVPLIWDGMKQAKGVAVWGANPTGLALAIASRQADHRLVAVAHPSLDTPQPQRSQRFPFPVGQIAVGDQIVDGRPVAVATSKGFGAVLVESSARRVTIVDDSAFMAGITLAAGIACVAKGGPVWQEALAYLEAARDLGLVMAEDT